MTGVTVDGGVLDCDVAVVAMGPWTSLLGDSMPSISGQKYHSIVMRPSAEISNDMLFTSIKLPSGNTHAWPVAVLPYIGVLGDSK